MVARKYTRGASALLRADRCVSAERAQWDASDTRTEAQVNHGTADKPEYEREYFLFNFPIAADTRKEPDEKILIDMIAALVGRVVRGPSTPRALPKHQQQAARDRLRTGEPAYLIAAAYGVDAATIEQLAR